ncbi:MAG: hypothetical protein MPW14_14835 [Candidatus Manganitrophus sp.]|nr:MAG: hypothetical protein MPW14_14835 [Candidatus Manganitrophus sp.]
MSERKTWRAIDQTGDRHRAVEGPPRRSECSEEGKGREEINKQSKQPEAEALRKTLPSVDTGAEAGRSAGRFSSGALSSGEASGTEKEDRLDNDLSS